MQKEAGKLRTMSSTSPTPPEPHHFTFQSHIYTLYPTPKCHHPNHANNKTPTRDSSDFGENHQYLYIWRNEDQEESHQQQEDSSSPQASESTPDAPQLPTFYCDQCYLQSRLQYNKRQLDSHNDHNEHSENPLDIHTNVTTSIVFTSLQKFLVYLSTMLRDRRNLMRKGSTSNSTQSTPSSETTMEAQKLQTPSESSSPDRNQTPDAPNSSPYESFIEYAQDFSYLMKQIIDYCDMYYNQKQSATSTAGHSSQSDSHTELLSPSQFENASLLLRGFCPENLYLLAMKCYIYGAEAYFELSRFDNGMHCLKLAQEARRKADSRATKSQNGGSVFTSPHEISKFDAKMWAMKAIGYGRLGRIEKCIENAQEAISIVLDWTQPEVDTYILDAIYLAGMMQWKQKNHEQARIWLELGVKFSSENRDVPRFMEMSAGLLACLLDEGSFSHAIDFYNEIMAENEDVINELIDEQPEAAFVRNFLNCVNRLQSVEKLKDLKLGNTIESVPRVPSRDSPASPASMREPPSSPGKAFMADSENTASDLVLSPVSRRNLYGDESLEHDSKTHDSEDSELTDKKDPSLLTPHRRDASFGNTPSTPPSAAHLHASPSTTLSMDEIEKTELIFNKLYFEVMEDAQSSTFSKDEKFVSAFGIGETLMHQLGDRNPSHYNALSHSNGGSTVNALKETILIKMRTILNCLYTSLVTKQKFTDALSILERSRHMSMMSQLYSCEKFFVNSGISHADIEAHDVHPNCMQMIEIAQEQEATVVMYGTTFSSLGGGQDTLDIWVVNPKQTANNDDSLTANSPSTPKTPVSMALGNQMETVIQASPSPAKSVHTLSPSTPPQPSLHTDAQNSGNKKKKKSFSPFSSSKKSSSKKRRSPQTGLILRKSTNIPRIELTKKILELQTIIIQLSAEMDFEHQNKEHADVRVLVEMLSKNRSHERFTELLVELYDILIAPIEDLLPQAQQDETGANRQDPSTPNSPSTPTRKHSKRSAKSSNMGPPPPKRVIILPEENMQYIPFYILKNSESEDFLFQHHIMSMCTCFKHIRASAIQHQESLSQKYKKQDFNDLARTLYGKYDSCQLEMGSSSPRNLRSSSSSLAEAGEGAASIAPSATSGDQREEIFSSAIANLNSLAVEVDNHYFGEEPPLHRASSNGELLRSTLSHSSSFGRVSPMKNRESFMSTFSLFLGDSDYIFELHAQMRKKIGALNAKSFLTSNRVQHKEESFYFLRHHPLSPSLLFIGWPGAHREKSFIQSPTPSDDPQSATQRESQPIPIFVVPHEEEEDEASSRTRATGRKSLDQGTDSQDNTNSRRNRPAPLDITSQAKIRHNHKNVVLLEEFSKLNLTGTMLLIIDQASSMQTPVDSVDSFNLLIKTACEKGVSSVIGSLWSAPFPFVKKEFYSKFFTNVTQKRQWKDEAVRNALLQMVKDEPSLLSAPWLYGGCFLFGSTKRMIMI